MSYVVVDDATGEIEIETKTEVTDVKLKSGRRTIIEAKFVFAWDEQTWATLASMMAEAAGPVEATLSYHKIQPELPIGEEPGQPELGEQ